MTREEKAEKLGRFPVFAQLTRKDLLAIASYFEYKILPPQQIFIKEGSRDAEMYFIISGFVRIFYLHETGKEMTVTIRMPGEIIGEMPVMDGGTRSANAETLEEAEVFILSKKHFVSLIKKYPLISVYFLKLLSERLREAIEAQKISSFETLEERTYHILQILSSHFSNDGITLSHEQLSILVNATQPRVTEALNHLKKTHKISLFRKRILLN